MFAALFRLVFGLIVACFVGGAVQVLFALTPAELAVAGADRWQIAAEWVLQSAVTIAMIAAPLVLLIGVFAELLGVRSFAFYLLAGLFVALAGFAVLYSGEGPTDPSLANSYAIAAYLTTGVVAGIAYWLVSGRFAGGRRRRVTAIDELIEADGSSVADRRKELSPETAAAAARASGASGRTELASTGTVPVTNTGLRSSGGSTVRA